MKHTIKDVMLHIRALVPSIWVVTHEEDRFIRDLVNYQDVTSRSTTVHTWSIATGWNKAGAAPKDPSAQETDPVRALRHIRDSSTSGIYILLDFHPFFQDVMVTRTFREIHKVAAKAGKSIIILSPVEKVPPELESEVSVLEYRLPGVDELATTAGTILRTYYNSKVLDDGKVREFARASLGLTRIQTEDVLYKSIIRSRNGNTIPSVQMILDEKESIVRKSGTLEFVRAGANVCDIGGLRELKTWFRMRAKAYSDEARQWNLPLPKGVLLLGVPGCGKSLACKTVANLWNVPLLRLDVGKVFGSLIGESESNIRRAIAISETVAPCILWIDEIEKGLSGTQSSGRTDGGTTARVFSSILTWLQEKTSEVFVIATANSIQQMPPELLRKGRFDEIFFVDLPSADERAEIFSIHLVAKMSTANGLDKADITVMSAVLAEQTVNFSGAEIEQVVNDALYEAYHTNKPVTTDSLIRASKATNTLASTAAEDISAMREWCRTRARLANTPPANSGRSDQRMIEI